MSSSSRPYQSRFLRLVLRQFQQGVARHQQMWNKAKSAVILGAQATLYPVYALLRTVRTTSQQLGNAPQNLLHRFRSQSIETGSAPPTINPIPPTDAVPSYPLDGLQSVDQPIIQTLTTARQWQLPTKEAGPLVRALRHWLCRPSSTFPKVRGIAMDIRLRSLQLIDVNNCVLPLLTDAQSQALNHLISAGLSKTSPPVSAQCLPFSPSKLPLQPAASYSPPQQLKSRILSRLPLVGALFRPGLTGLVQAIPQPLQTLHSHATSQPLQALPSNVNPLLPHLTSKASEPRQIQGALPQNELQTSSPNTPLGKHISPASAWEVPIIESAYVEHPLEKILRWLDRFLAWLEGLSSKVWEWFCHTMP